MDHVSSRFWSLALSGMGNSLCPPCDFQRRVFAENHLAGIMGPPALTERFPTYVRVKCDPRVGLFPQYRHMSPHTVSGRCGENSSWKLEFITQVPSCYSSGLMSGRLTTTRFLCRSKEDDTGALGCHVTTFGAVGRDYRLPRSRLVHPREQASHPRDRGPSA